MVYTMSIAFRPKRRPRSARELSIGYLDDLLIISFSLNDASGYFLETEVQDVFQNHQLCEDILGGQKTWDVFAAKNTSAALVRGFI